MSKPNFFILGAPKCGTTAISEWLLHHPNIFMSKLKEPHYYNKDHKNNVVQDYRHYFSLFENATSNHKIIGEASVWYLYSKEAVINIKNDLGSEGLKFLVMIRNPLQMAHSLHQQQVYNLNEPVENFKDAWNLQSERKESKQISLLTRDVSQLLYGDICKLGEQMRQLYNLVNYESVHVVLFDDLKENPEKQYKNVLNFLGLPFDGRKHFRPVNESKSRRSKIAAGVVKALGLVKHKLKITRGLGILNKAQAINAVAKSREKLDVEFEKELRFYFKNDILLLSSLIHRDLSHWLK